MRPAPTRLPLAQYTNAGRLPASSRTAATKLVNVASLTAPCPIGMLRYSSPAATTASGVRNGRGSIGSRMSITTAQPARFSAARCSSAGCPPVTTPGMGSEALGTPAMASSSWLIGTTAASFPHTIYPHVARHDVASPSLAARPLAAAPQAVAQLGRCVPTGSALACPRALGRSRRGPHPLDGAAPAGAGTRVVLDHSQADRLFPAPLRDAGRHSVVFSTAGALRGGGKRHTLGVVSGTDREKTTLCRPA